MSPVFPKPLTIQASAEKTETITPGPSLSVDLSDIINNAVAKLRLSSDRSRNKPKRKFKFPCGICEKNVNKNQKSVYCNSCNHWVHKSCEDLSDDEFQRLVEKDDEIPWSCFLCQIKHTAEIFPFGLLSKLELLDLYGVDLPSHLHTLPSFETLSKLVNLPNMNDFDIDNNNINIGNSKYHSLDEINKIKLPRQNISIFHTNIRSLSKHFDLFHSSVQLIFHLM